MSINIPAPLQNADVEFFDAAEDPSQESSPEVPGVSQVLFSSPEDSIGDFSEDDPTPSPSSSISSFSSPPASESILKNFPIVSSDPNVVEQIDTCSSDNSSSESSVCNSNVSNGLKANNVSNGPDGAKVSSGPKMAKDKKPKVSSIPKMVAKDGPKGPKVGHTVSSDSDSEFKRPLPVSGTPPPSISCERLSFPFSPLPCWHP